MKGNRGKDTKPELQVRKILRELGFPGYRVDWRKAPGRPDIAYPGRKIAIMVHGCFWHRCPICNLPMPKSHLDYWAPKFERNVQHDAKVKMELEDAGWTVVTIWECQLKEQSMVRRMLVEVLGDPLEGTHP